MNDIKLVNSAEHLAYLTHNSQKQTPIEIALRVDGNGMTTAKRLYEFLELTRDQYSRWAKKNIIDNKFAFEGEDYWGFDINVEGNITRDYRITSDFAKKLAMASRSSKGETARDYFICVENNLKEVARNIESGKIQITSLPQNTSPELQMLKLLYDGMVNQEVKVNALEEKVTRLEENAPQNIKVPSVPVTNLEIQAMEHIMKKEMLSTVQIASRYGLAARTFYRLLNTLGFVAPAEKGGWQITLLYTGKGLGTNYYTNKGDSQHCHVQWTPKGRELIEESLKYNGIKPIKRLAPKKRHKKRSKKISN